VIAVDTPHGNQGSVSCALFHSVQLSGAHILPSEGGHGTAEGEVGHHGKAVDPHDDHIAGNDQLSEAVGQGLDHNHGHGEDGLGQARGQAQFHNVGGQLLVELKRGAVEFKVLLHPSQLE